MVKVPDGFLRRPGAKGFIAPQTVLDLLGAVETLKGAEAAEDLCKAAQIFRIPAPDEPIREDKVARLHQTLRRMFPDVAGKAARIAARKTAEGFISHQFSIRGRSMLSGAPWTISAWLLGRWATQNAWVFAGGGTFEVASAMEFKLTDNPLIKGERVGQPICDWHAALFGHMFRKLVDPRLVCREMTCAAAGADACRFAFYLGDDVISQMHDAEAEPHLYAPEAPLRGV